MNAYRAEIEWDEDGCILVLRGDESAVRVRLDDPEQLYDAVKGGIGPYLRERDEARASMPYDREAFSCEDPFNAWVDMLADNADHSRRVAKGE